MRRITQLPGLLMEIEATFGASLVRGAPDHTLARSLDGFGLGPRRVVEFMNQSAENWLMSSLGEAEKLLPKLSRAEKAQLLQWVATELADASPGIEITPGVCGGEARIVRTRIPVWVLEQARRLNTSEADLLRSYPTLRAEDLVNAWGYVRTHRAQIDEQIRDNEEA